MKIIEKLEALVERYTEDYDIAEVQLMNGYSKGWMRSLKEAKNKVTFFSALLKMAKEDMDCLLSKSVHTTSKTFESGKKPICWSNYRVVLLYNKKTGYIDPFFWTPGLGVDNSHRALMDAARKEEGDACYYDYHHRWAGFYLFGYGNGYQEALTLYGESSDYPHNWHSEKVKECFLKGIKYTPEEEDEDEQLPF